MGTLLNNYLCECNTFHVYAVMQLKSFLWLLSFYTPVRMLFSRRNAQQAINYLVTLISTEHLSPSSNRKCAFWNVLVSVFQRLLKPGWGYILINKLYALLRLKAWRNEWIHSLCTLHDACYIVISSGYLLNWSEIWLYKIILYNRLED